ncbi:hypothetical protein KP509_29G025500 [Ceratopteris richardii]|nr:hypothetical protein KP509_29G025500 [Ceratopteris richardii]
MGGGPRTYPGGVSKWQWKRMLVKQREERERIRLAREKEFFAMRQRAEILASHPELQQPWEKLATFPTRDVSPSQQIAGLVRRFHRPHHAEDLWTERDGPQKGTESLSVSGTMESDHNKSRDPSVLSNSSSDAEGEDDLSIYERNQLSSSMRSPVHLHTAGSLTVKRKKNETSIEKNMQDYLDSFGTDPLGVVVKTGTQQSKKEVRKDPLGLSMTCKAAEKKKVGKGGRKNRGR